MNEALPEDMRDYGRTLDKKGINDLLREVAQRHPEKYPEISKKLNDVGRTVATEFGGYTFGLDHLATSKAALRHRTEIRAKLKKILDNDDLTPQQRNDLIVKATGHGQQEAIDEVFNEAVAADNPLAMQSVSGSRGNKMNVATLLAGDRLYADHHDNVIPLPVLSSYSEGLKPSEYWAATYGARRGTLATKFAVRDAGYLSKQLNQINHRLMVVGDDDPRDLPMRGLPVDTADPDNEGALLAHDVGPYKRNTVLTPKMLAHLKGLKHDRILVRSPIVGGSPDGGVYARDLGIRERGTLPGRGEMVGLTAAQALSEPLSQGQLSAKHSGGVAGQEKAVGGFKLIDQMVQVPSTGWATHAEHDGLVQAVDPAPAGGFNVWVNNEQHYVPREREVKVKRGDTVEAGDVLSSGYPNPASVVQHKGIGEGKRYFVQAFHGAMKDAGMKANRRNIELLARGLINHVKLTDEFADYVPEDVVPYSTMEHLYQPREDRRTVPAGAAALNKYLEKPVLHYSVGTKVRPSVLKELQHFGVKDVDVHDDPPPFEPQMVRGMYSAQNDPDWMTRMYGSGLKASLLDATARGATSDELGTSFVPSLTRAVDFGRIGTMQTPEPGTPAPPEGVPLPPPPAIKPLPGMGKFSSLLDPPEPEADTRPYRDRSELYAMKDGKLYGALFPHGGFGVYGGGIDPGEDGAEAAAREFAEEAGHTVTNVRPLPFDPHTLDWKPPYDTPKLAERAKHFRGSRTHYFVGDLGDPIPNAKLDDLGRVDPRLYDLDEAMKLADLPAAHTEGPSVVAANKKRMEILKHLQAAATVPAFPKPKTAAENYAEALELIKAAAGPKIDSTIKPNVGSSTGGVSPVEPIKDQKPQAPDGKPPAAMPQPKLPQPASPLGITPKQPPTPMPGSPEPQAPAPAGQVNPQRAAIMRGESGLLRPTDTPEQVSQFVAGHEDPSQFQQGHGGAFGAVTRFGSLFDSDAISSLTGGRPRYGMTGNSGSLMGGAETNTPHTWGPPVPPPAPPQASGVPTLGQTALSTPLVAPLLSQLPGWLGRSAAGLTKAAPPIYAAIEGVRGLSQTPDENRAKLDSMFGAAGTNLRPDGQEPGTYGTTKSVIESPGKAMSAMVQMTHDVGKQYHSETDRAGDIAMQNEARDRHKLEQLEAKRANPATPLTPDEDAVYKKLTAPLYFNTPAAFGRPNDSWLGQLENLGAVDSNAERNPDGSPKLSYLGGPLAQTESTRARWHQEGVQRYLRQYRDEAKAKQDATTIAAAPDPLAAFNEAIRPQIHSTIIPAGGIPLTSQQLLTAQNAIQAMPAGPARDAATQALQKRQQEDGLAKQKAVRQKNIDGEIDFRTEQAFNYAAISPANRGQTPEFYSTLRQQIRQQEAKKMEAEIAQFQSRPVSRDPSDRGKYPAADHPMPFYPARRER